MFAPNEYDYEDIDNAWDEYGFGEAMREIYELDREEAEREWAERWTEAWDRLEALGVVTWSKDSDMTLAELERLTAYLPESPGND